MDGASTTVGMVKMQEWNVKVGSCIWVYVCVSCVGGGNVVWYMDMAQLSIISLLKPDAVTLTLKCVANYKFSGI